MHLAALEEQNPRDGASPRPGDAGAVVVDARCFQDPRYGRRGVGLHALLVLRATRAAAIGGRLVLLTSAELPALDEAEAALGDEIVTTPYPLRGADVRLFVEPSPMTASTAATVPFLASRRCRTASVVLDFIPTEFPNAYLTTATAALENRARLE